MSKKNGATTNQEVWTARIEMTDGSVLLYSISKTVKEKLNEKLHDSSIVNLHNGDRVSKFVCFHAQPNRYVFVRKADISRIILCWDPAIFIAPNQEVYRDNFSCVEKQDEEHFIPDIIIKQKDCKVLIFSEFDTNDTLCLDESEIETDSFLAGGFIALTDEDGEMNYISAPSISIVECNADYVYMETGEERTARKKKAEN